MTLAGHSYIFIASKIFNRWITLQCVIEDLIPTLHGHHHIFSPNLMNIAPLAFHLHTKFCHAGFLRRFVFNVKPCLIITIYNTCEMRLTAQRSQSYPTTLSLQSHTPLKLSQDELPHWSQEQAERGFEEARSNSVVTAVTRTVDLLRHFIYIASLHQGVKWVPGRMGLSLWLD